MVFFFFHRFVEFRSLLADLEYYVARNFVRDAAMKSILKLSRSDQKAYMRSLLHAVEQLIPSGSGQNGKCRFAIILAADDGHVLYATNTKRRRMARALNRAANRMNHKRADHGFAVKSTGPRERW